MGKINLKLRPQACILKVNSATLTTTMYVSVFLRGRSFLLLGPYDAEPWVLFYHVEHFGRRKKGGGGVGVTFLLLSELDWNLVDALIRPTTSESWSGSNNGAIASTLAAVPRYCPQIPAHHLVCSELCSIQAQRRILINPEAQGQFLVSAASTVDWCGGIYYRKFFKGPRPSLFPY